MKDNLTLTSVYVTALCLNNSEGISRTVRPPSSIRSLSIVLTPSLEKTGPRYSRLFSIR